MVSSNNGHAPKISFRQNKSILGLFDLEMKNLERLKKCSSAELHLVLYPFSRKISRDHYAINPFEEYVEDLAKGHKSAYLKIRHNADKIFGIFLGILITMVFLKYRPDILVSVESVVGIFGAYFIGKDIWSDIEDFLVHISRDWRLRYQDSYYSYTLDKNSTLAQYSAFAKKQRYGKKPLLPDKMDFIEHHNSSTARLFFSKKTLAAQDDSAHLFSIAMSPAVLEDFERVGYLLGVKLSMNKKFFFFEYGVDSFQSLSKGKKGCLDQRGRWLDNTVHYRKLLRFGSLKLYLSRGYWHGRELIE